MSACGGTVYVTNEGTNVVQLGPPAVCSAAPSTAPADGNPAFGNPVDVSESAETGKVFVADDAGNSVEQFSSTGTYEFQVGRSRLRRRPVQLPRPVSRRARLTASSSPTSTTAGSSGSTPRSNSSVVRTSGTQLIFEARAGDANVVTISQSGSDYTVTDTGNTLIGGGGCTVTSGIATCSSTPAITSIRATTLDGIDSVAVTGTTAAVLDGGTGNDTLTGGSGNDTLTGGDGERHAERRRRHRRRGRRIPAPATGVTVDLSNNAPQATGGAGTDTIASTVEGVTGSPHVDTLTGNTSANSLTGGAGDDILNGGGGDDTLDGGAGTGDTVSYSGAGGGVTVTLASSSAQATGGSGTDTLAGFENLTGSSSGDSLTGGAGANSSRAESATTPSRSTTPARTRPTAATEPDTVTADSSDTVAADCESVTRADATPPAAAAGGTGGGAPAPTAPGAAPAPTAPVISGLAVTRMRSGRAGTFSYSLDKAANVMITIEQVKAGRKIGRVCKKQTRKNRKKRACTLFVAIGKLSQSGAAGRNTLRFSGKLGGQKLKAGLYRATALAAGAGGKSGPATAKFVVSR